MVESWSAEDAAQRDPNPSGPPGDDAGAVQTLRQVGQLIRHVRRSRGLTLKELSNRTGISISMLSMLERGVANASVATLVSIAAALKVSMHDLFDEPPPPEPGPVTYAGEHSVTATQTGVVSHALHHDSETRLDLAIDVYAPGTGLSARERASRHDGREFGLVLSGEITVQVEDKTYSLTTGDTIAYSSLVPHRIYNASQAETRVMWANFDGRPWRPALLEEHAGRNAAELPDPPSDDASH